MEAELAIEPYVNPGFIVFCWDLQQSAKKCIFVQTFASTATRFRAKLSSNFCEAMGETKPLCCIAVSLKLIFSN